jgi:GR25 family glycosyltransferase involved in LPS biosynthesis
MDTYYINLESEEARRRSVEESFAQFGKGTLNRVQAVDAGHVVSHAVPGGIRDPEKACILSHRCAIDLSRGDSDRSLIVEDDVRFGPSPFHLLGMLGNALDNFDVVFTDIGVGTLHDMIRLFFLRRER